MEKKTKQVMFRLSEAEHHALKVMAAKQKKTVQEIVIEALDKSFPDWRKNNE